MSLRGDAGRRRSTGCAWARCCAASARPTRWPTPSGRCACCPARSTSSGVAVVVALSVAPQLVESVQRVRRARRLRGAAGGAASARCAASRSRCSRTPWSARCSWPRRWTRAATAAPARRPARRAGVTGGAHAGRAARASASAPTGCSTAPRPRAARAARAAGRRRSLCCARARARAAGGCSRTRYRPDPWRAPEWIVAGCGVVPRPCCCVSVGDGAAELDPSLYPLRLAAAAARCRRSRSWSPALPAFAAPPPVRPAAPRRPRRRRRTPAPATAGGRRDRASTGSPSPTPTPPRPCCATSTCTSTRASCAWSSAAPASGKSTLLGAINGLVPHFTGGTLAGRVTVDGRDTADAPAARARRRRRRRRPGPARRLRHRHRRGGARLRDGAARPSPPDVMRKRVEETLDLLGLAELRAPRAARAVRRPAAAGRDRRRCSPPHPRVLVLDEPTSALDPTAAEEVLAADHPPGARPRRHRRARRAPARAGGAVRRPGGPPAPATARVARRRRRPRCSRAHRVAPPVVELGRLRRLVARCRCRCATPGARPRPLRDRLAGPPCRPAGAAARRRRRCCAPAASSVRYGDVVAVARRRPDPARPARSPR